MSLLPHTRNTDARLSWGDLWQSRPGAWTAGAVWSVERTMSNNASVTQERIAEETPRPVLVCAICDEASTDVRRYSDFDGDIPPHTACPSCSYNPVVESRDEFLDKLQQ